MSAARPTSSYAGKTPRYDQPYWAGLAGKTPRQKRTTVLPVDGHNSLMDNSPKAKLCATTRVDHPGIAIKLSDRSPASGYTLTLVGSVGLRHPGVNYTH